MYKYNFTSFEMAFLALKIARKIIPSSHWYITNEGGGTWHIVEDGPLA